jgi:two-component system sensor histidine kinase RegB
MTSTAAPKSIDEATGPDEPRSDTPGAGIVQGRRVSAGLRQARSLILLRCLFMVCQASVIAVVGRVLGYPIAYLPCFALIGMSALFSLGIAITPAAMRNARPWEASGQLAFDILQLSGLLYFTGGVVNPFCFLLIVPVTVAGTTLPQRHAFGLTILAIACSLALAAFAMPLPGPPGALAFSSIYRLGCAIALIAAIAFACGYAAWTATEGARMALALHVTETVLAREQRLSALGGLAAAAAHELGTPLATITVVAKELARETKEGPLHDDAWLLVEQAQRCRDILQRLAEKPETTDALHERMSLLQIVREVLAPYAGKAQVRAEAVVTGPPGMTAPDLWRRPEVLHAMTSIVENAFDFARAEILVTARFDADSIALIVRDDGPGFNPDVLATLGEPYVTSRPGAEGSRTGHVGMGLGFFIAKTLLERSGAKVEFANARSGGAIVTVRWPRSLMEAFELVPKRLELTP